MTKKSAIQQLDELKQRNKLSVEEALQAYRLSLALDDVVQVSCFANLYNDLGYILSLDIALNITKSECRELFFQKHEDFGWIPDSYCLAIIIKQKDQITNYEEFEKIFSEDAEYLEYIHSKKYSTKNIDGLKEMYLEEIRQEKQALTHRLLDRYARTTKDISIAERILGEICDNMFYDGHDRSSIHGNILNLLAENNFDEAVGYFLREDINFEDYTKYAFAKKIYKHRPSLSETTILSLSQDYFYAFQAFIANEKQDREDIKSIIDSVERAFEEGQIDDKTFDHAILKIGFTVVENYPLLAFSLIDKLHTNWSDLLDLQQSVAESFFAKGEIDLGVEYFSKIEAVQPYALAEMIQNTNDQAVTSVLVPLADAFNDTRELYYIYVELYRKGLVPFDKMYQLASTMMPDDYDCTYNPEILHENYEGYFAF